MLIYNCKKKGEVKMKKRRYLKKWVEVALVMILLISLMVLGSESETYFITSKIVALTTLLASGYILFNYGRMLWRRII